MPKYLVTKDRKPDNVTGCFGLDVMEIFYDTLQGEGIYRGKPSIFLRLQGCVLDCVWCDTEWRKGARMTYSQLLHMFSKEEKDTGVSLVDRLQVGHHLVITGGSPLKQQKELIEFLDQFETRFKFMPFIEIENECVLLPMNALLARVSHWNNSPKLASSGMKDAVRYKPKALEFMKLFITPHMQSYKFVIGSIDEWEEIENNFIKPGFVRPEQIVLMPLGATLAEIQKTGPIIAQLAIDKNVTFSNRDQLILNIP